MVSLIDPTVPVFGSPTTESVRENFQRAHDEISYLQGLIGPGPFLPLAGGVMGGALSLFGNPTAPTHAATKAYVDQQVSGGGTFVDAPSDGSSYGRFNATWAKVLPLTGGQLTGNLTIAKTGAQIILDKPASGTGASIVGKMGGVFRWQMLLGDGNTETAGGGSDFAVTRFSDTGVNLGTAFLISRLTGNMQINSGTFVVNGAAATARSLIFSTVSSARWQVGVDATAEGAGNTGSTFVVNRYSNAGAYVSTPLSIDRATGNTTLGGSLALKDIVSVSAVPATNYVAMWGGSYSGDGGIVAARGPAYSPVGDANGVEIYAGTAADRKRWLFRPSGGLETPGSISMTGSTSSAGIDYSPALFFPSSWTSSMGLQGVHQVGIAAFALLFIGPISFSFQNSGNAYATGSWIPGSDGRVKTDVRPIRDALEKLSLLVGATYRRIDQNYLDGRPLPRRAGVIAQDVQGILPEAIHEIGPMPEEYQKGDTSPFRGVDPMALVGLLVEGVKELTARLAAIEAVPSVRAYLSH